MKKFESDWRRHFGIGMVIVACVSAVLFIGGASLALSAKHDWGSKASVAKNDDSGRLSEALSRRAYGLARPDCESGGDCLEQDIAERQFVTANTQRDILALCQLGMTLVVAVLLWRLLKSQVEATKASTIQAMVARRSLEELERPFLSPRVAAEIGQERFGEGKFILRFSWRAQFECFGRNPGHLVSATMQVISPLASPRSRTEVFDIVLEPGRGQEMVGELATSPHDWAQVAPVIDGEAPILLQGQFVYQNLAATASWVRYFRFRAVRGAMVQDGGPDHNYEVRNELHKPASKPGHAAAANA